MKRPSEAIRVLRKLGRHVTDDGGHKPTAFPLIIAHGGPGVLLAHAKKVLAWLEHIEDHLLDFEPERAAYDARYVLEAVTERRHQRMRWDEAHDDGHSLWEWAGLISYYAARAARGLHEHGCAQEARASLVKAEALCIAARQSLDRRLELAEAEARAKAKRSES